MARKNANSSPGVWLGLLLVLVAHTLAQSTHLEQVPKYKDYQKNEDSTVLRQMGPPPKRRDLDDGQESIKDNAKDLHFRKRINENSAKSKDYGDESYDLSEGIFDEANVDETTTTMKTHQDRSTPRGIEAIRTTETIDSGKHLLGTIENTKEASKIERVDLRVKGTGDTILEEIRSERGRVNEGKVSTNTTRHEEFEFTEEQGNFEDHTSSEHAEATTPSPKDVNHRVTISLINDTNVNYHEYLGNDTRQFEGNDTSIIINGVNPEHEPKHDVEIFKNATHPTILRITEEVGSGTVIDNTTPYYSSSSHPKDSMISITSHDDLTTKVTENISHGDVEQSASETITKIVQKKPVSTEKQANSTPYPYLKSETKSTHHKLIAENLNITLEEVTKGDISAYENTIGRQTSGEEIIVTEPPPSLVEKTTAEERTTEEISAQENIIGRQKSNEEIIVTEPSLLFGNSIQQFKPIHNKRSGNSSRVNSTLLDKPVTSTAWELTTTEELASKNVTEVTEGSETTINLDNGNRSHINNDVPQDNPNTSVSTQRSPVILSEVTENNIETGIGKINGTYNLTASTAITKKLTERSEVTGEDTVEETSTIVNTQVRNSTERILTVSNSSATNNEDQTESQDLSVTQNQLTVTERSTENPLLQENFSTSTEIYSARISNATEKLNPEMSITVFLPVTISTTRATSQESSSEIPTSQSTETRPIEENIVNVTGLEPTSESHGSARSIPESTSTQTTNVEYEFIELTTPGVNSTVTQVDVESSEKMNTTIDILNVTTPTTESLGTVITDSSIGQNQTTVSRKIETIDPGTTALPTLIFDTTTTSETDGEATTAEDLSGTTNSPVPESSFTTVTDVYIDTTLSATSFNGNTSHGHVDVTTSGQSYNPEEITTTILMETVPPSEETTTISNIEVIIPLENTTSQTLTTTTQSTTVKIQRTSELPEFPISSDDVTLFVRVIIEGSWNDVCPSLNNLRQSLANLLTVGTDRTVLPRNIILHQTQCSVETTSSTTVTPVALYVVDDNGNFDYTMTEILPSLYKNSEFGFPLPIHSVEKLEQTEPSNNAIAVVAVSSVAFVCLVLLAGLLFIMRKRQTRFNYGERCRPVSLDAFRVDSVSAYNSVRRKGLTRASKRSYGNPAFEDSSVTPSHPLNFAGLSSFCNDTNAITEEFEGIPQVNARMDELPAGSEVKNRYANVAPLPETRVILQKINNEPLTEYINASYVRGPKNATKYYIACQAPMESTVSDFWRMIWEQQSKVIIMLTDIIENGVEKCVEYIPPSEVTDCHRLYGDYQVTLKKREAKEKYAISTLHLKNLENNTYREVSHIWYLWPTNGVPSNGTGLIAILLEARALQRGAPGPIVVHCSPGTGRTGTLIALDLGIRQYEITRTVDVPRVVYTIRRDRAGAVQTKEQYAFIYKALNLYAAKLAGGALESM